MYLPVPIPLMYCFICKPRGLLVLKALSLRGFSDVQEASLLRAEHGARLRSPGLCGGGPRLAALLSFRLQGGQGTHAPTQTRGTFLRGRSEAKGTCSCCK